MSESILFSSYQLGPISLKNRMVMSPMTRSRSPGNVPNDLVATYYGQRAEAGLIVTEGTAPAPEGLGYARIPGLFDEQQARGWKKVTDAVHAKGGRIFVQLMHTGRVSHPDNMPKGARVVAPSAIGAPGKMYVDGKGELPYPTPEAMSEADIAHAVQQYVDSAALAIEAGFDGVELHGANGYLIDQFLNTSSNQRSDGWGGSVENRIRFGVEVAKAVAAKIGGDRLGIRVSPFGAFNGMAPEASSEDVHEAFAKALGKVGLIYMHIVDHSSLGAPAVPATVKQKIRAAFPNTIILAGGYDRARAEADLTEKRGDLIAFGRPFLANPNLVTKLKTGAALNAPDFATFYTPGEKGYTDYPL